MAIPCKRQRCKLHTAPRASITCHARKISRRVHVAQGDWGILLNAVCVFLKSHSILCHRTLLDLHFFSLFSTLALGSSTSPSLLYPSTSPSTATLQGGLCFGRLAEQYPLTGYEPKSLIEVSSEHTPFILPWRRGRGSLDTNVHDLATTLRVSEVGDMTDVDGFLRIAK